MKSSQEDITLLETYLKGRLSEESVSALKKRLAAEKILAEDLNELQIMIQGMRADVLDNKLSLLKDFEKEKFKDEVPKESLQNKNSKPWWMWWLVLISIVLFSWLGYYFIGKKQKKIPQEYQHIYADRFDGELILHKTMRAAVQSDSLSAAQRRAYELYSIQLFDEAIPLLDALWANQKDTLALFYLGVSRIGIGEIDTGQSILQRPELKKYSEQTNIFIHH